MRNYGPAAAGSLFLLCAALILGGCSAGNGGWTATGSAETEVTGKKEETYHPDKGLLAADTDPVSDTGFYFDTVITITLYGTGQQDKIDGCFALADRYEKLFSNTVEGSDIDRINRADGDFVEVSEETVEVLKKGLEFCKTSSGIFDLTIGGVSGLWDFTGENDTVPDKTKISEALKHVDYTGIEIEGSRVALKDPDAVLDLGGIAKGFIADRMREYLLSEGVESGIINLGGNVLVVGSKPDGSSYTVGIEKPFETQQIIGKLQVTDQSVVTSGIYQRYFEKDGRIYHHILDPKTGCPVENGLYSVTIISDRSVDGDGLSTTCFLLGPEKGMQLIEQTDGVEAIFVDDSLHLTMSSGIGSEVSFEPVS